MLPQRHRKKSAIILCLLLLLSMAFGLSSCMELRSMEADVDREAFLNGMLREQVPLSLGENGEVTPVTLAQALVFAVNDNELVPAVIESLPSACLQGIDESLLRSYVQALAPEEGKKVQNFEALSEDEQNKCRDLIVNSCPELTEKALRSVFFRLNYVDQEDSRYSGKEGIKNILAIQQNEQGKSLLDKEWVEAVVSLHDFAALYFAAIADGKKSSDHAGSLAYLISQGEMPFRSVTPRNFAREKADQTIDYYRRVVNTEPTLSHCLYVLPGQASFLQDYQYGERFSAVREVIFKEKQGKLYVHEAIPVRFSADEAKILVMGEDLFSGLGRGIFRATISESDIHPLAGSVLSIEELEKAHQSLWRVHYYGLSLDIRGTADPESGSFRGSLERIEFSSRIFSFGQGTHVGLQEGELYGQYPFLADDQYIIEFGGTILSRFKFDYLLDHSEISNIILERVEPEA